MCLRCNHTHSTQLDRSAKDTPHGASCCASQSVAAVSARASASAEHATHTSADSTEDEEASPRQSCCSASKSACSTSKSPSSKTSQSNLAQDSNGNSCDEPSPLAGTADQTTRVSWQIQGMDCPSCARKIENAVKNLAGVEQARVLFTTEKLVVDLHRGSSAGIVTKAVKKAGFNLINDEDEAESQGFFVRYHLVITLSILMLAGFATHFYNPLAAKILFGLAAMRGLLPVGQKALKLARTGTPFAIETLMSIATIGALFLGETGEAGMVMLLFIIGEQLEAYAANRARQGVKSLMALVPDTTTLLRNGQRQVVAVSALKPGDLIEVSAGGRLPADVELVSDQASFDESALTGESIPIERLEGEKVMAGCLVVDQTAQLRVVSKQGQNAIDRILHLIEEAEERKAPIERFIDRFSRWYTPMMILAAVAVILIPPMAFAQSWDVWIYRGLALLLIGCPCALVISTPAAVTSALAAASRRGALIKGGAALEQLGQVETVAFDKTGTLTQGKPQVTDLIATGTLSESELLAIAYAVELGSHHPLATAICQYATEQGVALREASNRTALAGRGVRGEINGLEVQLLAPGKSPEQATALSQLAQKQQEQLISEGKTLVVIWVDAEPQGIIALRDELRDDATQAVAELRKLGINSLMLTGDNPGTAAVIAGKLGIDYQASLLPEDKVEAVAEAARKGHVAMVGDGINDAPALKQASIGIAMGGGSDVALETADAALTHNRIIELANMIGLSRATRHNIRQNITLALGLKGIVLITSLVGLTGLWVAVLADTGTMALVTLNALRLLRYKK
ncbi:zinc/cadmium/mercury/lead-transporting ATPase [Dongshaea marina]|uniref:zinc/cadmium/mercury/lead-transporting ATPase n=1 Tax=Dongshaea marina TaxID=2047966 RepID=UPI000D3ED1E1|nr:zinc/cadmium/mercury/lead-transporting ATPase [Dongshaea marina]